MDNEDLEYEDVIVGTKITDALLLKGAHNTVYRDVSNLKKFLPKIF